MVLGLDECNFNFGHLCDGNDSLNLVFRIVVPQCQIVQQKSHMEWSGIGADLLGKRPRTAVIY